MTDIVLQTGFAAVFPEYTLAPEVVFPTQHEQVFAVLDWMTKHGGTKGLREDWFAVAGDSAGGASGRFLQYSWLDGLAANRA